MNGNYEFELGNQRDPKVTPTPEGVVIPGQEPVQPEIDRNKKKPPLPVIEGNLNNMDEDGNIISPNPPKPKPPTLH